MLEGEGQRGKNTIWMKLLKMFLCDLMLESIPTDFLADEVEGAIVFSFFEKEVDQWRKYFAFLKLFLFVPNPHKIKTMYSSSYQVFLNLTETQPVPTKQWKSKCILEGSAVF